MCAIVWLNASYVCTIGIECNLLVFERYLKKFQAGRTCNFRKFQVLIENVMKALTQA